MTRHLEVDRLIEDWLSDLPSRLPDRVVDAVVDELDRTPQWKRFRLPWRDQMNRLILAAGAAAAVVVVAALALGLNFNANQPGFGGAPSPSPSAEPSPPAEPSPTAEPSPVTNLPSWYTTSETPTGPGILPAGSHTTQRFSPGFTFSVPDGWVNPADSFGFFELFPDTPANEAQFSRSESLAQNIFMGPHSSPYFTCESAESNSGATAAEMVAAMVANEALAVSEPVDVAIGGLTGKQVDVRRNPDWTGTCPEDSDLPAGVDPEDERIRAILLDVPGRGVLIMFLYSMSSAEHEAFLAEAMPILESFQFSQ